jgi:hypothetical protein
VNVDDLELELRKLPGVRAAGFTERDDVLLIQLQVSGVTPPSNLPLQATRIAYRHSEKPVALEVVRWRVSPAPRDRVGGGGSPFEGALGAMAGLTPLESPVDTIVDATVEEPTLEVIPERRAEDVVIDAGEQSGFTAPEILGPAIEATEETRGQRVRLLAVLTFPDTDELEVHLTFEGRRIIGRAVASNGILGVVEAMVDGLKVFVPELEYRPSWARLLDNEHGDTHVVACELLAPNDARRLGIASGASAIEAAARATLQALNRAVSKLLGERTPV